MNCKKLRLLIQPCCIIIILFLALSSCEEKGFDLNKISGEIYYNPKLSLSIGTTSFTIDELLSQYDSSKYVKTDPKEGFYYVIYDKDLPTFQAEDKLPVPPQTNVSIPSTLFALTIFSSAGEASITVPFDIPIVFNPKERIDSIDVKSFLININGSSTYTNDGLFILNFPTVQHGTLQLSDSFNIPKNANVNVTSAKNGNNYKMSFSSAGAGISHLTINVTFKLVGGIPNSPVSSGNLTLGLKITELKYHSIYGYLGSNATVLDISDSLDLGVLNNQFVKNIEFADPELKIYTINSYVAPVQLNILSMTVHSSINNQDNPVTFLNSSNQINLKSPTIPGRSASDSILFISAGNSKNTDLGQKIQQSATNLKFHITAVANPSGTPNANIVLDTSQVKSRIQFYLPIWFRSGGFGTTDTLNLDLSQSLGQNGDSIQNMLFRLSSENGLPIDMNVQIYFADSTNHILDSMFKDKNKQIVKSGIIDNVTGKVTSSTVLVKDIIFKQAQLRNLQKTQKMFVKASLSTANYSTTAPFVKFYSNYKLKLHFEFQVQPKITTRF